MYIQLHCLNAHLALHNSEQDGEADEELEECEEDIVDEEDREVIEIRD